MEWIAISAAAGKVWRLVNTPTGRAIALAIAAVIVTAIARAHWINQGIAAGVAQERAQEALRAEEAAKAVLRRENRLTAIAGRAQADLEKTQTKIQTKIITLTKEIPVYVPPAADVMLPAGFVRLYDAAATQRDPGSLSAGAGGPVEAPSGLTLAAATPTFLGNLGAAHECLAEVATWRSWYTATAAEFDRPLMDAPHD